MEYKLIDLPQDDTEQAEDYLNALANEGWRFVGAVSLPDTTTYDSETLSLVDVTLQHKVRYILERPKVQKNNADWRFSL